MKSILLGLAALGLTGAAGAKAAPKPSATAHALVRIDKPRIDAALAEMVSSGRVAGVSALLWKDGHAVYFRAAGDAEREAARPMRRDTTIQIYFMT